MKTTGINPKLALVNGALAALILGTLAVGAFGQPNAVPVVRPRGDYTMVAGKTTQGSRDAIYVMDATNREMVIVRWDNSRKSLVGIGYRNLDADSALPPAR